ncbi:hypothetical protein [Salipiger mucosus]|uniref:HTH cro/C1-type domain-containing protein n=1 Tax=Salipiger mucosus DSM 16094 TaxID=1123237 RepID=S9R064_9RHOB|nr:hypothetical protein [Salipiger mucosus]EPX85323.1 hypothetical protein Salmuc_02702 [Salipiger mucosus DSM 16094]
MTDSPTTRLIADTIDACGKTQREIAEETGFERPNVVSMLKHGEMRMPVERIPPFSRATGIDPLVLTRTAMTDYMPEIWAVLTGSVPTVQEEVQFNIRAPSPVVERFKQLCLAERRSQGDMFGVLVHVWDGKVERMV